MKLSGWYDRRSVNCIQEGDSHVYVTLYITSEGNPRNLRLCLCLPLLTLELPQKVRRAKRSAPRWAKTVDAPKRKPRNLLNLRARAKSFMNGRRAKTRRRGEHKLLSRPDAEGWRAAGRNAAPDYPAFRSPDDERVHKRAACLLSFALSLSPSLSLSRSLSRGIRDRVPWPVHASALR
jgi:hypothetical protein